MRGPMLRIQLDIRRTWKCPECGYKRRAHADQTAIRCHCQKEGPFMKLVEAQRKPRPSPEELPEYFEFEEEELAEEVQVSEGANEKSTETAEVSAASTDQNVSTEVEDSAVEPEASSSEEEDPDVEQAES